MRRFFSLFLTVILLCTFLSTMLAGCSEVTQIESILNDAINTINNQPTAWQATLTSTIDQLKSLSDTVTTDVENLLSESTALVTTQVQCNIDILGLRVADALSFIENQVKGVSNPPLPTPWVCVFVPNRLILTQASSSSPWTLSSQGIEDIYGVNFRSENLPAVDLLNSQGNVVKQNVLTPRLQSAYLLQLDFQPFDFSQINKGDYFALLWKNSSEQYALSVEFNAAVSPETSYIDFRVIVHQDGGNLIAQCENIQDDPTDGSSTILHITGDWIIDQSQGDPGHPGISELSNNDNTQADNTLKAYNYQATNNVTVKVTGKICSAPEWGAGAWFDRTYRVYLIKPS